MLATPAGLGAGLDTASAFSGRSSTQGPSSSEDASAVSLMLPPMEGVRRAELANTDRTEESLLSPTSERLLTVSS